MMEKHIRIFFKSKETDMMLKPMDVKVTEYFIEERILCLVRDNQHHSVCIPIENILQYEIWWEDENG